MLITRDMVQPWSEVSDALAPNFTMTGDSALAKVLPVTERIQNQFLHAFGANLAIGLPGSSTSSTMTVTKSMTDQAGITNGVPTTTSTNGATTNSSVTDNLTPGVAPSPPTGIPASAGMPVGMSAAGELGIDPLLQYKAANYLNQSVQLLNRAVQNAAVNRCMVAYVVKLKLAVLTHRPRLGYAVNTRIAFLGDESDNPVKPRRSAAEYAAQGTPEGAPGGAPPAQAVPATTAADCADIKNTPIVLPILASDDLQMAVRSNTTEVAQQFGLALSFMLQGVGGSAAANKLDQSIKAILNHDVSSSMTVTLQGENIVYVTIAPNNAASGQAALVGQNYDIALLLLVPRHAFDRKTAPVIHFDSFTELRDVDSGRILPSRPNARLSADFDRILATYSSDPALLKTYARMPQEYKLDVISRLIEPIQQTRYARFRKQANCPRIERGCDEDDAAYAEEKAYRLGPYPELLYVALSGLSADDAYQSGVFQLPRPRPVSIPDQDALVLDDGKASGSALLYGVAAGSAANLIGRLELQDFDKGQASATRTIPATGISYNSVTHVVALSFPSPAKYKIKALDPASPNNVLVLNIQCDASRSICPAFEGPATDRRVFPVHLVPADPSVPATFTMIATSDNIALDKTWSGRAELVFDKLTASDPATVTISGAGLSAVSNATLASNGSFSIAGPGAVYVSMFNLVPGATVTVTAKTKASGSATVALHPMTSHER